MNWMKPTRNKREQKDKPACWWGERPREPAYPDPIFVPPGTKIRQHGEATDEPARDDARPTNTNI